MTTRENGEWTRAMEPQFNMNRKLASVQRALEIIPIPNADAIELVRINGWQCVTKKGEFAADDLGVFLEIDAVPPDNLTFQFLWTAKDGTATARPDKFRIRTMKLRGALSQGLFLPLTGFDLGAVEVGQDVTEALGVTKYEPPLPAAGGGEIGGLFPGFVPKTDEIRVQSAPEVIAEIWANPYAITLKYDGTSATFCVDPRDGAFLACGRNYSISEGESFYWRIARHYDLPAKLAAHPNYALQGEICGPGIQKNRLELKQIALFCFNVYDIAGARYLGHDEAREFLAQIEVPAVETLEKGDSWGTDLPSLLRLAEGKYPGTSNEREGIVIRPLTETRSEVLAGRLSFKAISNRFLLKEGE